MGWNGITIKVDAVSGVIREYNYQWHDCNLPPVTNIVPRDELTDKLLDEAGMYPAYKKSPGVYNNDPYAPFIPLYLLNTGVRIFDAQTGQPLNHDGSAIIAKDIRTYSRNFKPVKEDSKIEKLLIAEEKVDPEIALKAAEEFFKSLGLSGEVQKSGGGSGVGDYNEHWDYHLKENNKDNLSDRITVQVNVYTGKVSGFYRMRPSSSTENIKHFSEISYEKAVENARKMIEKINPEKSKLVVVHNDLQQDQMRGCFWLRFDRLFNGIPCIYGGIRVEVDRQTGDILNYSVDWNPGKFTPLTNLITSDKAKEIIKADPPLELAYMLPSNENCQPDNNAVLVYRISGPERVDAFSGEIIGCWGEKKGDSVIQNDFAGHWAAPALFLLKQSGLLPKGNINPDRAITRRDAIKILITAADSNIYYHDEKDIKLNFEDIKEDNPDCGVILQAVKKGILENKGKFAPNQTITRENLAVWLVNCLGYQEIALMKHKIELPFKDADKISADKKNYVGLANGLGLLTPDKYGNFRPQAECTWAEIATIAIRLAPQFE